MSSGSDSGRLTGGEADGNVGGTDGWAYSWSYMRRMPIGSVGLGGVGVLAELPIMVVAAAATGGEITLRRGVGGEIGRSGGPANTLEAAVAAVAARTTIANWLAKSIVLAARVCISKPSILP